MADISKRDQNRVTSLLAVSNVDATQTVTLYADPTTHELLVSADVTVDGANGSILDGVDTAIKATVFDYTNSNPLAVVLRDTNGDYVSVGGGTQYATNVAYADGNIGTLALSIRDDALSTLTEADGDYSGLRVTSTGALWATLAGTVPLPTGAATAALQTTGNTSLNSIDAFTSLIYADTTTIAAGTKVDDAAFTPGTTRVMMAGFTYDDTTPDSVNEGDAGAGRMSANRNQYVTIRDGAGNERGLAIDAGGALAAVVSATNLDIRELAAATDSVTIHGDVGVVDQFDLTNSNPLAMAIVDGDGTQITSFGGGTQYATNVAYADGNIGTLALTIRDDALSTLTEADGDYSGLRVTSTGALWTTFTNTSIAATQSGTWNVTNISGTVSLPTGAATLAEQQTQTTALGTILTSANFAAAFGTAGTPDAQVMSIQGITSMTPVQISDGGNIITVDGTVAVTQSTSPWIVAGGGTAGSAATGVATIQGIASMTPVQVSQATASNLNATVVGTGTFVTQSAITAASGAFASGALSSGSVASGAFASGSIAAGAVAAGATSFVKLEDVLSADADAGVPALAVRKATPANTSGTDGDYEFLQMSAGRLWTSATIDAALPAGTNAIGKLAANSGVDIGDVDVTSAVITGGGIADDSTTPGNPVMVGGSAKSPDGTDPGNVSAENDVTRVITDLNRRLYTNPYSPRTLSFHSDGSSALTDTTVVADPGDGFQIVVLSIMFSTGAATACNIFFEEGSTKVLGPWYLEAVAGRGVFWSGYKPITASTALTVTTSASIAQSLDVTYMIQAV